ncbi:MAG TPA: restriction endonuclease subunit S, partial [Ginsengibacter sp.]|nr:restriction endonuclease subunit S [Ginsengibacter sp.]
MITDLLKNITVEWKTLGESLVRTKGTSITAGQMKELHKDGAPLKIFAGGKTTAFVDYDDIPSKDINREPSIIVKSRGVIEFEYYDKPFSHKNEMWSYHSKDENLDIKFVYYFLKIQEPHFQNIAGRMQMPQISIPDTDKFQIPIPPLKIQQEIVFILDKFTELTEELTEELTAELTARKKQYNYYREQLLMVNDKGLMVNGTKAEWKTLGEVFEMKAGQHIKANNINATKSEEYLYPCYGGNGVRGFVKNYSHDGSFVLIGRQGALCGNVQRYKGQFYATEHAVVVKANEGINVDFAFYFLDIMNLNQYASKSAQPGLAVGNLLNLKIPIPPLSEQERIVGILDKFDTLTTSISEGLPKEIELRKKQYEYYREQLLTFPPLRAATTPSLRAVTP